MTNVTLRSSAVTRTPARTDRILARSPPVFSSGTTMTTPKYTVSALTASPGPTVTKNTMSAFRTLAEVRATVRQDQVVPTPVLATQDTPPLTVRMILMSAPWMTRVRTEAPVLTPLDPTPVNVNQALEVLTVRLI